MPALHTDAAIDVFAPPDKVRATLTDFTTWPAWSPWLCAEPDADISYRGESGTLGHGFDWSGKKVGAGGMTLKVLDDDHLEFDLKLLKPYKSSSKAGFEIEPCGPAGSTRVTWYMESSLPFFMFWFTQTMTGMIRNDYRRGLLMLKDLLETGTVPTRSDIQPIGPVDPLDYLAVDASAAMPGLSDSMASSFSQVARQARGAVAGTPFSLFRKLDMKNDRCDYTAAMPVEPETKAQSPVQLRHREACEALSLIHAGSYRHLGTAWFLLMAEAKQRGLKPSKKQDPFEVYLNDRNSTHGSELVTQLYYPIR